MLNKKHSLLTGISFGLTSGIITTLGLIVGLHSGTHSKMIILGGILTIAVADSFSDALGIHIAEESENIHAPDEIWMSTVSTFLSKFIFALTFVIPILLFKLSTAIIIAIVWSMLLLGVMSYYLARIQNIKPWKVITEHLVIALVVIVCTHYIGHWISTLIGTA